MATYKISFWQLTVLATLAILATFNFDNFPYRQFLVVAIFNFGNFQFTIFNFVSFQFYQFSTLATFNFVNFQFCQFSIQLNEYGTDPYFLQNSQSNTTVCLIIHVFCKNCEPEIVLAVLQIKTVRKPYKPRE